MRKKVRNSKSIWETLLPLVFLVISFYLGSGTANFVEFVFPDKCEYQSHN